MVTLRTGGLVLRELTLGGDDGDGFIRGEGVAAEVDDEDTKKKVYDLIGWARNFFDTVEHPDYVFIEIMHTGFSYRRPGEYETHCFPVE